MARSRIRYPGAVGDYAPFPTHYRLFCEPGFEDERWHIDAVDDEGGMSEWVASFPTFQEAVDALPEVQKNNPLGESHG